MFVPTNNKVGFKSNKIRNDSVQERIGKWKLKGAGKQENKDKKLDKKDR